MLSSPSHISMIILNMSTPNTKKDPMALQLSFGPFPIVKAGPEEDEIRDNNTKLFVILFTMIMLVKRGCSGCPVFPSIHGIPRQPRYGSKAQDLGFPIVLSSSSKMLKEMPWLPWEKGSQEEGQKAAFFNLIWVPLK